MTGNADEENKKALMVDEDVANARLDAWLASKLPAHISRTRIKELIKSGQVRVDSVVINSPNYRLQAGQSVDLQVPEPTDPVPQPENIHLNIVYEDEHLIIINKPVGMVVHPAAGNWSGTLVNALLHHCGDGFSGIGGVKRPGIVHRLDKDTTGVMVVAKTEKAHASLSAQFADHGRTGQLERSYLAVCWGTLRQNIGTIDTYLGRSSGNRLKRAVVKGTQPDAKHAITHYKVLQLLQDDGAGTAHACLVECKLETGRTHQIRVHMAHLGHPLIGDQDYGLHFKTKANALPEMAKDAVNAYSRQALHAATLGFCHPQTGEFMKFEAKLPEDIKTLINALGRTTD